MASNSKVTRINNRGLSSLVAGTYLFLVDYQDLDPLNPPTGTVIVNIPIADVEDPTEIRNAVDSAITIVGASTVDWDL